MIKRLFQTGPSVVLTSHRRASFFIVRGLARRSLLSQKAGAWAGGVALVCLGGWKRSHIPPAQPRRLPSGRRGLNDTEVELRAEPEALYWKFRNMALQIGWKLGVHTSRQRRFDLQDEAVSFLGLLVCTLKHSKYDPQGCALSTWFYTAIRWHL